MEIYVKNMVHQSLLDSFTRKYKELLYIISEAESIYRSLHYDLQMDSIVSEAYRELYKNLEMLVITLRMHNSFLSEAEQDYYRAEKNILINIDSLTHDSFFEKVNSQIAYHSVQDSIVQSAVVLSGSSPYALPFSYVPIKSLSAIAYQVTDMPSSVFSAGLNIEAEEEITGIERDYSTYTNIVTNISDKPQTSQEYMTAVFEVLNVEHPMDTGKSMTDCGWYLIGAKDVTLMAAEGYPSIMHDSSGFVGMVLSGSQNDNITICRETGTLDVKVEPDMLFYIHM